MSKPRRPPPGGWRRRRGLGKRFENDRRGGPGGHPVTTARQFQRGVVRTLRAIERDAQRREKLRVAHMAADAAGAYAELIRGLVEAHRVAFSRRDWSLGREQPGAEPLRTNAAEGAAVATRDAYRPGALSRALGIAGGRRARLERAVGRAREADERAHREACEAVGARNARIAAEAAVIALESGPVMDVVEALSAEARLPIALTGLSLEFGGEHLVALADCVDVDGLPDERVTLLQSGKASVKPLAKARIHELHRDTACALAARMAVEILQALPVETVDIVVNCNLLDRGSGMLERRPVLSLRATAQAIATVNLDRADPSLLIEHLGGRFAWTKRDGFAALS